MPRWLFLVALIVVGAAILLPTNSLADGCKNQKWCFESDEFAFRITDNEVTIEMLRRIEQGGDTATLIDYLLRHSSRFYMGWLRPTPEMHSVYCDWNVGLQLKSGEVIWAEKWFVGRDHGPSAQYDPDDGKHFIPGVDEDSPNHKSFIIVLAFPAKQSDGKEWKNGQVKSLVVKQRDR